VSRKTVDFYSREAARQAAMPVWIFGGCREGQKQDAVLLI